ncbi:MAG: sulfite exporter TauE/SafE family protein [Magnetococcales bacterium]|nr:sulfite exporter TauE/SafE family protein [Magnetococcales bacterium]MBF0149712.1 sulfite exporter TauE/SafE family protein [Magnetococcales bacterium]MBF0174081.1 sulfite exporter TauE/SafE family protein [Magnetococcales bacterium]MBF0349099.1 sulfite exporter TauE/SafE family protein [Magnetococcales bacterium]
MPWLQLLPAWFAVAIGALIQGTIGFGIALIAAPLLLLIKPELIPGPMMFATFFLTSLTWWRERHAVHWRDIGWAWVGRIAGTLAGTAAMVALPSQLLISTMGLLIVVAAVMSLNIRPFHPSQKVLGAAGFLSGVMGTMTSAGGPPMLLALQHVSGSRLRATLGAFFTLGIVISLASLTVIDRFGWEEAWQGMSFVPAILLGFSLSNRLLTRINKEWLRRLALVFSGGSGLMIVLGSLSRWIAENIL